MSSTATIQTSCVVTLSVDEYNELRHAEIYRRLAEDEDFIEVDVVNGENHVRLCVPMRTTVGQLTTASVALMNLKYEKPAMRDRQGVFLCPSSLTLDAMGIQFGGKLYIGWE